jgi:hypothetical protein
MREKVTNKKYIKSVTFDYASIRRFSIVTFFESNELQIAALRTVNC